MYLVCSAHPHTRTCTMLAKAIATFQQLWKTFGTAFVVMLLSHTYPAGVINKIIPMFIFTGCLWFSITIIVRQCGGGTAGNKTSKIIGITSNSSRSGF